MQGALAERERQFQSELDALRRSLTSQGDSARAAAEAALRAEAARLEERLRAEAEAMRQQHARVRRGPGGREPERLGCSDRDSKGVKLVSRAGANREVQLVGRAGSALRGQGII